MKRFVLLIFILFSFETYAQINVLWHRNLTDTTMTYPGSSFDLNFSKTDDLGNTYVATCFHNYDTALSLKKITADGNLAWEIKLPDAIPTYKFYYYSFMFGNAYIQQDSGFLYTVLGGWFYDSVTYYSQIWLKLDTNGNILSHHLLDLNGEVPWFSFDKEGNSYFTYEIDSVYPAYVVGKVSNTGAISYKKTFCVVDSTQFQNISGLLVIDSMLIQTIDYQVYSPTTSYYNVFTAYSALTGNLLWQTSDSIPDNLGLYNAGGDIFCYGYHAHHLLDRNGNVKWAHKFSNSYEVAIGWPVYDSGYIYVAGPSTEFSYNKFSKIDSNGDFTAFVRLPDKQGFQQAVAPALIVKNAIFMAAFPTNMTPDFQSTAGKFFTIYKLDKQLHFLDSIIFINQGNQLLRYATALSADTSGAIYANVGTVFSDTTGGQHLYCGANSLMKLIDSSLLYIPPVYPVAPLPPPPPSSNLTVYPNPAQGNSLALKFLVSDDEKVVISLGNGNGVTYSSNDFDAKKGWNSTTIGLPAGKDQSGILFLQVATKEGVMLQKVVVIK